MKELSWRGARRSLGFWTLLSLVLVGCGDAGGGSASPDAGPDASLPDADRADLPPPPPGYTGPVLLTHPRFVAGSRLKVESIVGADGARDERGLWDSMRMEACAPGLAEDGKLRCLPPARLADYYSDPTCVTPVAVARAGSCEYPYYRDAPPQEGVAGGLWRAEPAPPGTMVYQRRDRTGCDPVTPEPGSLLLVKGAHVDPTMFVEVTAQDQIAGGDFPVAARYEIFADGARVRTKVVDSRTGAACDLETASDGTERCFPVGPGGAIFTDDWSFADSACTVRLTQAVPADEPVTLALDTRVPPTRASHLYRVKERHDGAIFMPAYPHKCQPSTTKTLNGYVRYRYDPADEVPPTELGRVEPWPDGGSRLHDEGTIMAGGVLLPRGRESFDFVDSKYDQDCSFQDFGDGSLRCLPRGQFINTFGDPACTSPVFLPERRLIVRGGIMLGPPGRHLVIADQSRRCFPYRVQVFELGPTATAVYWKRDGKCESQSDPRGYYFPGAPAAPDQFVAGELRRD
jgi:hypothetical protein